MGKRLHKLNMTALLISTVAALGCLAHTYDKRTSQLRYHDDLKVVYGTDAISTSGALVQQVVFVQGEERLEFTAMVEFERDTLTMAGISPLGNRLFLCTATPSGVHYESQMLFELPFPPQYLVRDFLLMFANETYLRAQLKDSGRTVGFTDAERTFDPNGDVVVAPNPSGTWPDEAITLKNRKLGYTLSVMTVQVDIGQMDAE